MIHSVLSEAPAQMAPRRRWLLASVFGTVLGAAAAAVVWQVIPTTCTCYSELRIRPGRSVTTAQPGLNTYAGNFPIDKQTVMKQVTDQLILTAVLRNEKVSGCVTLRDVPYPELWLRENIVVSAPGTEYIRISLTTEDADSAHEIVSAITSEFNLQVIERYRKETSDQLDQLRELLRTEDARLQVTRKKLKEMDRSLHASRTGEAAEKKKAMLEMRTRLRNRINDISMEIIEQKLQAKLVGSNSQTEPPDPSAAALVPEKIKYLEAMKLGLEEELKTIKIEEESFGDAMVTRTELAEDNLDLEQRVQSYEDRVYNLQIAVDTDPPPIEVTHKPEFPRQPELSRKIKLATVSGLGICVAVIALSVWIEVRRQRVDTVGKSSTHSVVATQTP